MQGMQEQAARRLKGFALALALSLCLAPAAQADGEVAPAPAPAPAPEAVAQTAASAGVVAQAPTVRVLSTRSTRRRALRVRLEVSRDATVSVALRRLPTGTLMMRKFAVRAGTHTLTVARGLRGGRYGVRVIAIDPAGARASVRAAPVRVR